MSEQPPIDWRSVVERIERGDPEGAEILYRTLVGGARLFLQRRLGTDEVEDRVHDVFVTVVDAIRRGEIRQPERLMGFVRTVLNRQLAGGIRNTIRTREKETGIDDEALSTAADSSPEGEAITRQKVALMKTVLREMSDRDFEVLSRFYLREQTPSAICREMGLTQVQFQLLKSRAKARLADLLQRKLRRTDT
jgi:RNA polymerase sigma factor (sigma-70 family)